MRQQGKTGRVGKDTEAQRREFMMSMNKRKSKERFQVIKKDVTNNEHGRNLCHKSKERNLEFGKKYTTE